MCEYSFNIFENMLNFVTTCQKALKSVEKMEETQEMNMTNKVNIEFLRDQLEKALSDIEDLKDKVRANGNGAH